MSVASQDGGAVGVAKLQHTTEAHVAVRGGVELDWSEGCGAQIVEPAATG